MKQLNTFIVILFIAAIGLLASCGGSSSSGTASAPGGGGIGGTGVVSKGSIDGFGSIFVNGIRFDVDNSLITLNGDISSEQQLRIGMVVTVEGSINEGGRTGIATSVSADNSVQGPIATLDRQENTLRLSVLGVSIIADRTSTVFDDATFDNVLVNDIIEVSGFYNNDSTLIATRIEKKGSFVADVSEIELKGVATNVGNTSFTINSFTVDFTMADLSELSGGVLTNGLAVEVKGTLNGSTIKASRVKPEDDFLANQANGIQVELEGYITNFISSTNFTLNGINIDASSAVLIPSSLVLGNNAYVEIEGRLLNGVLVAEEIEAEAGDIKAYSRVGTVDTNAQSIDLLYANGDILTVFLNNQTQLDDKTDVVDNLTIFDINNGDFLEVRAYLDDQNNIIATEVKRDELDDQLLQGSVSAFDIDNSITIEGVTFFTNNSTEFQDGLQTSTQFYNTLSVGSIVKIEDDDPADGTADEVEYED